MKGKDLRHIAALDALRGIAALAVVIFHMTQHTILGAYPPRSYLAVDFFFVLSGYVIAHTYEDRLLGGMSIWSFVRVRLIRLYPLIVLGTLMGFVAKIAAYLHFPDSGIRGWGALFAALLFGLLLIPNRGLYDTPNERMFELDTPAWSLMFEIWINLIYAILVRVLITPVLLIVVIGGALMLINVGHTHSGLEGGYSFGTFAVGIARVWFSFSAGVLIHRLVPSRSRLPRVPFYLPAAALAVSFLAPANWSSWYEIGVVLMLYPAIVIVSLADTISDRWRPAAIWAGALSYPVYILHGPALAHFEHFRNLHGSGLLALIVAAVLATLLLSHAATRWYDEPIRRWLTDRQRRIWGPKTADSNASR